MNKIKPKLIRVDSKKLQLDNQNPRLPESIYKNSDLNKLWEHMKNAYDLDELALSMVENGYFEAEPMVVIPKDSEFSGDQYSEYIEFYKNTASEYIVVEGNRRLSTIQGLLDSKLKYDVTDTFREDSKKLPVLLYPNRNDVLAFLGVHHLLGVRKWNIYERARFIVSLKRDKNLSIDEIQKSIGDRRNSAKQTYGCYRLIEILEDYDESFNTRDAKEKFSFLQLATGQGSIKDFLGLKNWKNVKNIEEPIPQDKKENLKFLFSCMFDNGTTNALIRESRDISGKLSRILNDKEATNILKETLDIDNAYDMVGGELIGINKLSNLSKRKLEIVNGKLSSMEISNIITSNEGKKLKDTVSAIKNIVNDINSKFGN